MSLIVPLRYTPQVSQGIAATVFLNRKAGLSRWPMLS